MQVAIQVHSYDVPMEKELADAPKQENFFRSDGLLLFLVLDVLNRQLADLSQLLELEKEGSDITCT